MRKDNGIIVYEETDKCALDEYSEQLAKDIEQKFKDEAYDDTEIKQGIQQNSTDISNIKTEQETQNNELEELRQENEMLKNMFPTGETEEAEYLNITDSAEASLKELKVSGNSTQETREGYNLANLDRDTFSLNGITVTNNKDGSFTLNGTSDKGTDLILTKNTDIVNMIYDFENSNYLFKTFVISGNVTNAENKAINTIVMGRNGKNKDYNIMFNDLTTSNLSQVRQLNTNYKLSRIEVFIAGAGIVFNNYRIKILLAKSDDINLEWEQYGASPSPEYPSPIQNVEGNVEVEVTGKNWFDNTLKNYGRYGMKATTIPTGIRVVSDTDVGTSDYRYAAYATINLSNYIGKTVRMKATIKSNSNLKGTYTIGLCNSNGTNRKPKEETATSEKIISFVVPDLVPEQEYLGIWFYCNNGGSGVVGDYVDYTNVIITIDNEDMTYEPYQSQTITFPLKEGQKLMQGDYLADDGIHHTKTQIQLDGITNGLKVSNVTKHSNNIYYCVINLVKQSINNTNDINGMYCSHFMPHFEVRPGSCYIAGYGFYLVLVLTDQTITTADAANTWLAAQKEKGTPVVIEYELAEEEVEPYTEEQKIAYNKIKNAKSYKNVTNIFSTNEISPSFKATYYKDLETYQRQQDDRITALEELLSTTTTSAMLLDNMQTDLESEV